MADNLRRGSYEEKGENYLAEREENKNKREEYFRKYGEEGLPAKNKAPWLKREPDKKHSRRLYSHDYCSRGYYHITATMKANTLHLSSLPNIPLSELKKNNPIYPILSPLGGKIEAELKGISNFHSQLKVLQYVIMPDHIHFVLQVKERLKKKLGYELAGFFGACSRHYTELGAFQNFKTLFERFHDNVIFMTSFKRQFNMSGIIPAGQLSNGASPIYSDASCILKSVVMNMRLSEIYSY